MPKYETRNLKFETRNWITGRRATCSSFEFPISIFVSPLLSSVHPSLNGTIAKSPNEPMARFPYSYLSAIMGSTLVARRAGM